MDVRYSQNSLNDFKNCPLKFKYKYIDKIRWQIDDKDYYNNIKKGLEFHTICDRYFSNIITGIENDLEYKEFNTWLNDLIKFVELKDNDLYFSEYEINIKKDNFNIQVKYDLLVLKEDKVIIYDWKTQERNITKRECEAKMQTIVYLYVLMESLKDLFNINHKNISMIYYKVQNQKGVEILYNDSLHKRSEKKILSLLNEIENYDFEKDFKKEQYAKHCKYCEFKNICN